MTFIASSRQTGKGAEKLPIYIDDGFAGIIAKGKDLAVKLEIQPNFPPVPVVRTRPPNPSSN